MKVFKMLIMSACTIVSVALFAQNSPQQASKAPVQKSEQVKFQCPMKCEGDKTYDKAGKCPKCGMALKEQAVKAAVFSCPMQCEGDKTYDKAGKCPKCGMALKEKAAATTVFSCPMQCEGDKTYDKAGKCPKCGMALKEKKAAHSNHKH